MVDLGAHAPRVRRIARRNPDNGQRPPDRRVRRSDLELRHSEGGLRLSVDRLRHSDKTNLGRHLSVASSEVLKLQNFTDERRTYRRRFTDRRNIPEPSWRQNVEGHSNATHVGPQNLGQFYKQKNLSNGLGPTINQRVNFNGRSKNHNMLAQRNGGDFGRHGPAQIEPNPGRFSVLSKSPSAQAQFLNGLPKEIRLAQKKGGATGGSGPAHMKPRSRHNHAQGMVSVDSTVQPQISKPKPGNKAVPGTSSTSSALEEATGQRALMIKAADIDIQRRNHRKTERVQFQLHLDPCCESFHSYMVNNDCRFAITLSWHMPVTLQIHIDAGVVFFVLNSTASLEEATPYNLEMENGGGHNEIPENANEHCPGTQSESAGKSDACEGCPNQEVCATAPKGPDPDLVAIAERMATVKHKILVLSGKGGVGKSTFSAQLSFALSAMDFQVGLLDIDICGPSIPKMLGLEGQEIHQSNLGWSPVYVESNLGVMSIGFMLPHPDEAVIWRGPRKNGIIKQFLKDVYWGELDFLVVDAPPGTSDEHISIVQFLQATGIDGAIIVTTPQQVSLIDVRKEVSFCKKVGLEVLGVVENMSGLCQQLSDFKFSRVTETGECTDVTEWVMEYMRQRAPEMLNLLACSDVFDSSAGGAAKMCNDMGVPFLGKVPLDPQLCKAAEEGRSCFADNKSGVSTLALKKIIEKFVANLTASRMEDGDQFSISDLEYLKFDIISCWNLAKLLGKDLGQLDYSRNY
ncbi:hypothetical protein F0562_006142 [Nyssa sinensis]|uniref:Cytosolic Fe-S cluster assembly factor NBP35 n=1 Tax=Nyssa sinensis TaxID=561372 RepID=A0A5J5AMI2_9ASTE|nr:hypothetical protein F0562_006142 [Nyssa sinensis]